ncbi:MAG: DUF885 domain-containing protein [Nitrososphaerota archaeon]|nr:DUF885 domain-containing protein [Candidatus Bathyarchaeota archaeon]MDW8048933.1 DUF885 domain-containing protein [Nitrososphaerota archaeon]
MTKLFEINPDLAVSLGLHEPYDYMLPNGSSLRFQETLRLMEEWLECLKRNLRREDLSDEHKIDWEVLEDFYERLKFDFYDRRIHELNPDVSEELGGPILIIFMRNYAPLEKRIEAIAARIEQMPRYLEDFRTRFERSQPVRLWTELAIEKTQNLQDFFLYILEAVKGKVSEEIYSRLENAIENVKAAIERQVEWLRSLLDNAKDDWALGREKFERLIQIRNLGMRSEEILQLGMEYLEQLKMERMRIAQKIVPGGSVEDALRVVEYKSPRTFEEALEYTRRVIEDAKRFVQEAGILTVYPEDILIVEETPTFLTPVIPFAALIMPAKFDKQRIGIYLVTRPRDEIDLRKRHNYPAITNTAVHEAFPGHFLQGALASRGSVIRFLAEGVETIEGWAHYCEDLMNEKGFIRDLETRLIQVNDMIWRAVRIIVDVKLSRGEMSFQEAVEMLVKEARMSEEAARAEVNRYTQTPGYQLSYLLGKHLILKLKKEIQQRMGERFDERFFHDTIAANGYLPISLIRKIFDKKISALTH